MFTRTYGRRQKFSSSQGDADDMWLGSHGTEGSLGSQQPYELNSSQGGSQDEDTLHFSLGSSDNGLSSGSGGGLSQPLKAQKRRRAAEALRVSNWQEDFYSDPQMYTHTGSLELLEDGDGALKEQGEGLRDERQHGEKDTVHTGAKHAKSMAPRGKEKKRGSKGKSTLLGSWEEPRGGKKSRDSSSQSSDGKDNKGLPPAPPRPNKLKVVPASALSVIPAVRMTASASLLEAQECGEIMESIDEAAYALDGLRAHCPLRVQQTSAATLASLCAAPQHRRVLQGHGLLDTIVDSILQLRPGRDYSLALSAAAICHFLFVEFSGSMEGTRGARVIAFLLSLLTTCKSCQEGNLSTSQPTSASALGAQTVQRASGPGASASASASARPAEGLPCGMCNRWSGAASGAGLQVGPEVARVQGLFLKKEKEDLFGFEEAQGMECDGSIPVQSHVTPAWVALRALELASSTELLLCNGGAGAMSVSSRTQLAGLRAHLDRFRGAAHLARLACHLLHQCCRDPLTEAPQAQGVGATGSMATGSRGREAGKRAGEGAEGEGGSRSSEAALLMMLRCFRVLESFTFLSPLNQDLLACSKVHETGPCPLEREGATLSAPPLNPAAPLTPAAAAAAAAAAAGEGDFLPCVLQGLCRLAGTHGSPSGVSKQQASVQEEPRESEGPSVVLGECVVLGEDVSPRGVSLGESVSVVPGAYAAAEVARERGPPRKGAGTSGFLQLGEPVDGLEDSRGIENPRSLMALCTGGGGVRLGDAVAAPNLSPQDQEANGSRGASEGEPCGTPASEGGNVKGGAGHEKAGQRGPFSPTLSQLSSGADRRRTRSQSQSQSQTESERQEQAHEEGEERVDLPEDGARALEGEGAPGETDSEGGELRVRELVGACAVAAGKVLMNVTNQNAQGCGAVASSQALAALASLLLHSTPPALCARARHYCLKPGPREGLHATTGTQAHHECCCGLGEGGAEREQGALGASSSQELAWGWADTPGEGAGSAGTGSQGKVECPGSDAGGGGEGACAVGAALGAGERDTLSAEARDALAQELPSIVLGLLANITETNVESRELLLQCKLVLQDGHLSVLQPPPGPRYTKIPSQGANKSEPVDCSWGSDWDKSGEPSASRDDEGLGGDGLASAKGALALVPVNGREGGGEGHGHATATQATGTPTQSNERCFGRSPLLFLLCALFQEHHKHVSPEQALDRRGGASQSPTLQALPAPPASKPLSQPQSQAQLQGADAKEDKGVGADGHAAGPLLGEPLDVFSQRDEEEGEGGYGSFKTTRGDGAAAGAAVLVLGDSVEGVGEGQMGTGEAKREKEGEEEEEEVGREEVKRGAMLTERDMVDDDEVAQRAVAETMILGAHSAILIAMLARESRCARRQAESLLPSGSITVLAPALHHFAAFHQTLSALSRASADVLQGLLAFCLEK